MKTQRRILTLLLLVMLLLCACGARDTQETLAPTQAQAPVQEPTEPPTEAPTEPEKPRLAEVVFPDADKATGALKFYIQNQVIHAGAEVSKLLNLDVTSYEDFDEILEPWHTSGVLRVRVELKDTRESDLPYIFFNAVNASDEPRPIRECLIYSITVNTDKGILFGSGKESMPFVTGQTTMQDMIAAYGEPDYSFAREDTYHEIAYYEPFNCAYFSFKNGVLRQVYTYYSANIYGDLAETFDHEFSGSYFGNDCYILMNQYMDVMPYLLGKTDAQVGVLDSITETITMGGVDLVLGCGLYEMPELFGEPLWDLQIFMHAMRYVRAGRNNPEEFYIFNNSSKDAYKNDDLIIKGVFTQNRNYSNWGKDNTAFHEFQYDSLTQDSTIEQILELYGMPKELHCTSSARYCFAWLFYEDPAGNTLRLCVDPITNQLIELRVSKYFAGEIKYP